MPITLPQAANLAASAFRMLESPFNSNFVRTELRSQVEALTSFSSLRPDVERLCGLLGRQKVADHEARIALLALEGRIWAQMIREGSAAEAIGQGRDALGVGKGVIDVAGIERAHRFVRSPFIESFLRAMGRQPHGGVAFHVRRTKLDLFQSEELSERLGRPVFFKQEDHQPVGSFKIRGATNMILHALLLGMDPARMRVGTASHGNHAQGVVRAALNVGIPPDQIDIYLPVNASPLKIAQIRQMGVRVILFGDTFEEAEEEIQRIAKGNPNYLFVPAFDNGFVSMGQGTIGVEIALQMAEKGITRYAVVVPAGGGGLIAGIATFLSPQGVRVIGVESEAHPYISLSFRKKKIIQPRFFYHVDTDADGIALQRIGQAGFRNILAHVHDVVAVSEEMIRGGIACLYDEGFTVEGAPASPFSALLYGALAAQLDGLPPDLPVVMVLSGRNIHPARLDEIVEAHGQGKWVDLDPKKRTAGFKEALEREGFLKDGIVRVIETAEDGIRLIDLVMENLLDGWDLLDALRHLTFEVPPGATEDHISASLRDVGNYFVEWDGSKEGVLRHKVGNSAAALVPLTDGTLTKWLSEDPERFNDLEVRFGVRAKTALVEAHLVDRLLSRADWSLGLMSHIPQDEREAQLGRLRDLKDRLISAAHQVMEMFRVVKRVREDLTAEGFMMDGVVLTLENARRGIELVRRVVAILDELQSDLDLIDVIECLNWGPIEHPKRINGTLRSLGMWGEREGLQSKRDALFHPYDNRATVVINLADHPDVARVNEILQGEFWMIQRLLVEMMTTEFFIDEERGWTGRIGKEGETAVDTNRHREHLRLNNRMLQGAMGKLARRLGVTVADFETMTEDRYRGLFQ